MHNNNDYKFLESPPEKLIPRGKVTMLPSHPLPPKDHFRVWTRDCGGIYSRDFQFLTDACAWYSIQKSTLPNADHIMLPIVAPCPWEINDES